MRGEQEMDSMGTSIAIGKPYPDGGIIMAAGAVGRGEHNFRNFFHETEQVCFSLLIILFQCKFFFKS